MKYGNFKFNKIKKVGLLSLLMISTTGCQTIKGWFEVKVRPSSAVVLPFIKNSANECYYLDEFMPVPDNMVTGKSGPVSLRYYTYRAAKYKEWSEQHIVLSFYSQDHQCWSLFEEFIVSD